MPAFQALQPRNARRNPEDSREQNSGGKGALPGTGARQGHRPVHSAGRAVSAAPAAVTGSNQSPVAVRASQAVRHGEPRQRHPG
jgi:hypothetical protein